MKRRSEKWFAAERLNEAIKRYGWIVTGVRGKAVYSVGFMDLYGHPEIAMHGMDFFRVHALLQRVNDLLSKGKKFEPGVEDSDVAEGYPTLPIEVHPSNYEDWFGQAYIYHARGSTLLKMYQLLWCDKARRFPGDPLYDIAQFGQQLRFDVRRPEYDMADIPGLATRRLQ